MSNAIVPIMSVNDALVRYEAVKHLASEVMVRGVDYGVIPGTNKPTLLKPGAEKLCSFFGMSPFFEITEKVTDWTGKEFNGEPFFYFSYRCSLHLHGVIIAQGEGSCNSWEKKYRWRNAVRVCPNCGQSAISRSQFAPKNKPNEKPGFFCNAKNGGCNAQFSFDDPAIVNQETGKMPNPDIADTVNTLQKMAQKRALIAAVLIGANASEFFTQDLEDFTPAHIDGDWLEVTKDKETGEITTQQSTVRKQVVFTVGVLAHNINVGSATQLPENEILAKIKSTAKGRELSSKGEFNFETVLSSADYHTIKDEFSKLPAPIEKVLVADIIKELISEYPGLTIAEGLNAINSTDFMGTKPEVTTQTKISKAAGDTIKAQVKARFDHNAGEDSQTYTSHYNEIKKG